MIGRIQQRLIELNLKTTHLVCVGGWNAPRPDMSFTGKEWFQVCLLIITILLQLTFVLDFKIFFHRLKIINCSIFVYQVWDDWNIQLQSQHPDFIGFDGIDWDLEGNDDGSYDTINPTVLNIVGEMSQVLAPL